MTAARRLEVYNPRELGAKCDICPLKTKTPVPSAWPEIARRKLSLRFAILGEAPGEFEVRIRKPFVGASGKFLDKHLYDVDLDRREAFITNTILCRFDHEDQFEKARMCCAPRLFRELEALPKEVPIIAMGKEAARAVLGVTGILKARGFVWRAPTLTDKQLTTLKHRLSDKPTNKKGRKAYRAARAKFLRQKIAGRVVLPTVHPAFVLRSHVWDPVFRVDMERIARFIKNDYSIPLEDQKPFVVVSKPSELKKLGRKLKSVVACDIETTGLRYDECEIRCVGIGDRKLTIVAYPWTRKMARVLTRILATRRTVGHNFICFDAPVLRYNGVAIDPEKVEDTMIASHAFASHLPKSLLQVVSVFCDSGPWKHEAKGEGVGEKGAPTQIDKLDPDKLVRYNASDVILDNLVWHRMQNDLESERHTYEGDKKIATLCSRMMLTGFQFDTQRCLKLDGKLEIRAGKLLRRMRDLTKKIDFNPANPYDIRKTLYKEFGAPIVLLTPTGLAATGKQALEQFRSDDSKIGKLADWILEWRSAMKTRNTFLSVYVSRDGRVHAGWRVGPTSGRIACRGPNLMNLPRYTPDKETGIVDLCDRVRECYIARPGYTLVYFDLAQAEARFAANLSQDPAFIAACAGDVHAGNAKVIFPDQAAKGWLDGKEAKEGKGKPYRDVAKNSGFAIYYLAGWETVYERLSADGFEVSPADCRAILDAIHGAYTVYYDFVAKNVAFVKEHGYMRTFGSKRIRWFGPFPNPSEVANYAIQPGIADHMNERLLQLEHRYDIDFKPGDAEIIAQIHDAAITECKTELVDDVKATVRGVFDPPVVIDGIPPFKIPVDLKDGQRWSEF